MENTLFDRSRYYPRLMIVEVNGTADQTADFSATGENGLPRAHIATNKALVKVDGGCRAECVYKLVTDWYQIAEDKRVWSNWQVIFLNHIH